MAALPWEVWKVIFQQTSAYPLTLKHLDIFSKFNHCTKLKTQKSSLVVCWLYCISLCDSQRQILWIWKMKYPGVLQEVMNIYVVKSWLFMLLRIIPTQVPCFSSWSWQFCFSVIAVSSSLILQPIPIKLLWKFRRPVLNLMLVYRNQHKQSQTQVKWEIYWWCFT